MATNKQVIPTMEEFVKWIDAEIVRIGQKKAQLYHDISGYSAGSGVRGFYYDIERLGEWQKHLEKMKEMEPFWVYSSTFRGPRSPGCTCEYHMETCPVHSHMPKCGDRFGSEVCKLPRFHEFFHYANHRERSQGTCWSRL